MAVPTATGKDAKILQEILDRYDYAESYWRDIHDEGRKDMLCVAGKPWEALDPAGLAQREKAKRPALALDELGQYFNQVINDVRANKRAVQFSPAGNGADEKTAEFYADKMRDIEYRSHAQIAYTIAFENAVQRGYGYVRLTTKRATRRALNYDLCIEPVHDPDSVLVDPESVMPDGSDMQWGFILDQWRQDEFLRKYPEAEIRDFQTYRSSHAAWVKDKTIMLAEYWSIKTRERELIHFAPKADPTQVDSLFADEGKAPKGTVVVKREPVDWPEVTQRITNGLEILETKPWVGSFIPIACCYGKVIYVDQGQGPERVLLSMTRLARDPYMLYCYMRTCQAEVVGGIPKFPYFIRKGSLDTTNLDNLAASVHTPIAVIEVEATVDGMQGPPEFPQRNPFTGEALSYMDMSAEAMRRAIQASMGVSPMPTQAQRRNEKSGVALKQIEQSQQKGSFHFVDHYDYMIQHVGTMAEDAMGVVYDSARQTSIRKATDKADMVWINNPQQEGSVSTKGDHIVTVSTGPNYESERDRMDDFVDLLAQQKELFPVVGHLLVKLKNLGPLGDELSELLEAVAPPPVKAVIEARKQKDGQQPMVPAQEMQAAMQQAQQQMGELQKVIETKQIEQQGKMQQAQLDNETRLKIAQIQADVQIAIAKLKEGSASAELQVQHAEEQMGHQVELQMQEREFQHEDQQQQDQQAHEAGMAQMQGAQSREAQAGQQSHEQQLAAHQSAAAREQAELKASQQPKGGANA